MVSLDCNAKITEGKELKVLRKLLSRALFKHTPDPQSVYENNPFIYVYTYIYFGVPTECSSALLEFAQKIFCFELEVE